MIGVGRRGVQCVVYIVDLRRRGGGELGGEEVVKGGRAIACWGDEEASLEGGGIRGKEWETCAVDIPRLNYVRT